jgi:hypothetical protein
VTAGSERERTSFAEAGLRTDYDAKEVLGQIGF